MTFLELENTTELREAFRTFERETSQIAMRDYAREDIHEIVVDVLEAKSYAFMACRWLESHELSCVSDSGKRLYVQCLQKLRATIHIPR
jgi:hypothetical protein